MSRGVFNAKKVRLSVCDKALGTGFLSTIKTFCVSEVILEVQLAFQESLEVTNGSISVQWASVLFKDVQGTQEITTDRLISPVSGGFCGGKDS